jgi:hypothetical protein
MRSILWAAVVGITCLVVEGRAQAQAPPWYGGLPPSYNAARAYHRFLTSPYSYRTYSAMSPGYATHGYTPFGYEGSFVDPGYGQQRITPQGFESYQTVPGRGGFTVTPFGGGGYYVPGYRYQYSVPWRPDYAPWGPAGP